MPGDAASLKKAKSAGYRAEIWFLGLLHTIFPRLRRIGSPGYSSAHPDLVQEHETRGVTPTRIVAIKEGTRGGIVVLDAEDFVRLVRWAMRTKNGNIFLDPVVVQVKRRKRTAVGRLLRELEEATK